MSKHIKAVQNLYPNVHPTSPLFMDLLYARDPNQARDLFYQERNRVLLSLVDKRKFKRVLELAGATGLLAEMYLNLHEETQFYLHTDYSIVACKLALANLRHYPQSYVKLIDVCTDLNLLPWNYDLVISTSLEHFPKGTDYDILKRMKTGTHVLWSLCKVAARIPTHLHPYESVEYVKARFKDWLEIVNIGEYRTVVLLHGIRL